MDIINNTILANRHLNPVLVYLHLSSILTRYIKNERHIFIKVIYHMISLFEI